MNKLKRRIQYLFAKNKTKWVVEHCYIDMFAASTPKGDFRELVKNAPINARGVKDIPFMDYEIEKRKFNDILDFYKRFYKEKYYKQALSNEIHLGCSPKFRK